MKKIILMGRSGAGKTTLTQALQGEKITYKKTQYINHYDVIIDTPGEYLQTGTLGRALAKLQLQIWHIQPLDQGLTSGKVSDPGWQ
jgi:ethanolamine utilization protein EutP (predicted NTPase)